MQRIHEIEDLNNIDLTGACQHGFKRKKSTSTAGLEIQSEIARALDTNKFTIMASLDLSSAFDIVNINLLIKRLQIMGLPKDLIKSNVNIYSCNNSIMQSCDNLFMK